jgi:hypothetical protein
MPINSGTGNPKPRTGGGIYSGSGKNVTEVYKPQDAIANAKKAESEKLKKEKKALQAEIDKDRRFRMQRFKDANVKRNAEIEAEKKAGIYKP